MKNPLKYLLIGLTICLTQIGCTDKNIVLENDSPLDFSKKCGGTKHQIEIGMQIQRELIAKRIVILKPSPIDDKNINKILNPIIFGLINQEKDLQSLKNIFCNAGFALNDSTTSTYPGFMRPGGSWKNSLNGDMYVNTPFISGTVLYLIISTNRSNVFIVPDDIEIGTAIGTSL